MPRLMSVAMTEDAVRARTKTVTRRKGWWTDVNGRQIIKPGDRIVLCRKVMGRKSKGVVEPLVRICEVEVVDVRRESLLKLWDGNSYADSEVAKEGFPRMNPRTFVKQFFVEAQGMGIGAQVTRIEFKYVCSPLSCECGGCVL